MSIDISNSDVENSLKILEYKNKFGFYPEKNDTTNSSKAEYRSVEHDKLKTLSSVINIIYYSFLVLLFMLLFSSNKLLLNERWFIYLILLILPYLYPWIFMGFISLKLSIFPNKDEKGPYVPFQDNSGYNLTYDI
jgi:hypothetical protein